MLAMADEYGVGLVMAWISNPMIPIRIETTQMSANDADARSIRAMIDDCVFISGVFSCKDL